ncbi:hypothetical protein [Ramlibacter sp. AN1133]|uniref:hypothetical protein n=1 Tax=Ramlibacter sp. AN1133 TaxID=3133429 RepID=UPI0030C28764
MARPSRTRPGTDDWKTAHWPYTMPSPEAREGGHSLWELWREAARGFDAAFAPTQPSQAGEVCIGSAAPLAGPSVPVPHPPTAEALVLAARHNNRVCPRPGPWARLYEALGGARYQDLPPPPVQPWQWAALSSLEKRLRFRAHIDWAARHRRLKPLAAFMNGLPEEDWLHMGES